MNMNEQQLQAIHTINGQIVIVACPGSGKTTTLLNRIHYMTDEVGIDPSSILMVTFSKAAADEMKARYRRDYESDSAVFFGTIHSFCLALIKKYRKQAFGGVVIEREVNDFLMKQLSKAQNIGNKRDFISDLKLDIGKFKNSEISISKYVPGCCKDKDTFIKLYKAYETYKESIGRIDYDDMLLIAYDILCNDSVALNWVRSRYKYIMVDEYQDINELQRDIIYKIAGENGNLAVVGDDDQAIYGFRGADPSIMLNFHRDYPASKIIYLGMNYRSNSEIVSKASMLISNNQDRFNKEFSSSRGPGGFVQLAVTQTREEEISKLVEDIKQTITSGINSDEIAVIYRINKQGTMVAKTLFNNHIEFKTNDKITGIYDHWIYNDIWAFYRMSQGRGSKYDFVQTLNHPNRFLRDEDIIQNGPDREYMIGVVRAKRYEAWKENNAIEKIDDYFDTLRAIRDSATPVDAIRALIVTGKYRTYLSEYAEYRNEDLSELNMVLTELLNAAKQCKTWGEWDDLAQEEKSEIDAATEGKSGVTLTTMHSAKGLEWKVVYIIDCVEGKCPYIKAKDAKELEEERRLFYVAMTRAKDRLVLMRSKEDANNILKCSKYLIEAGINVKRPEPSNRRSTPTKMSSQETSRHHSFVTSYKPYSKPTIKKSLDIGKPAPRISVGDKVNSITRGDGTITSIINDKKGNPAKFSVHFVTDGDKSFIYPEAFKHGLSLK